MKRMEQVISQEYAYKGRKLKVLVTFVKHAKNVKIKKIKEEDSIQRARA